MQSGFTCQTGNSLGFTGFIYFTKFSAGFHRFSDKSDNLERLFDPARRNYEGDARERGCDADGRGDDTLALISLLRRHRRWSGYAMTNAVKRLKSEANRPTVKAASMTFSRYFRA
jgi:hypothetical protein